jgi:quinohemoprotein ethanol dehydrogenase
VRGATGKLVWYYQEVPGDNWDYDSIADLMLLDLPINGRTRQVIMHAPKDGFFYVLDRVTGEVISADPITKVSWATGIDPKTGKPIVNPDARYRTTPVTVMPGPSGGHVWQPWTYSPLTRLMYFPGAFGGSSTYRADPNFVPSPTDIGPTGRGRMNMGTGTGGGGGDGGRGRGGNNQGAAPADLPTAVANAQAGATAATPPTPPAALAPLPTIGPDNPTGQSQNVLYAWDPIARKARWRAVGGSAGPFAGGSLSTAGNIVFSSVNNRLIAYNATTGDLLLELDLRMNQMGPPISFLLDGKQYIALAGAQAGGGGRGAGGGGDGGRGGAGAAGAPAAPAPQAAGPRPANLVLLALDGTAPVPGAPTN